MFKNYKIIKFFIQSTIYINMRDKFIYLLKSIILHKSRKIIFLRKI